MSLLATTPLRKRSLSRRSNRILRTGVPFAGGGRSAGLRDLGRLGLLMLNQGVVGGERLFPAEAVRSIREGGDASKFGTNYPALLGGRYSSMWWI